VAFANSAIRDEDVAGKVIMGLCADVVVAIVDIAVLDKDVAAGVVDAVRVADILAAILVLVQSSLMLMPSMVKLVQLLGYRWTFDALQMVTPLMSMLVTPRPLRGCRCFRIRGAAVDGAAAGNRDIVPAGVDKVVQRRGVRYLHRCRDEGDVAEWRGIAEVGSGGHYHGAASAFPTLARRDLKFVVSVAASPWRQAW